MVTALPDLEALECEARQIWLNEDLDKRKEKLAHLHTKYKRTLGAEETSKVLRRIAAEQGKTH